MTATADEAEADEAAAEARTAWLIRQSPDQIAHYSFGTILDWLDARSQQRIARLRKAVRELRAATDARAAAHERLARAIAPPAP